MFFVLMEATEKPMLARHSWWIYRTNYKAVVFTEQDDTVWCTTVREDKKTVFLYAANVSARKAAI